MPAALAVGMHAGAAKDEQSGKPGACVSLRRPDNPGCGNRPEHPVTITEIEYTLGGQLCNALISVDQC